MREPAGYLVLRPDALCELFTRVAEHLDNASSVVIQHDPDSDDE